MALRNILLVAVVVLAVVLAGLYLSGAFNLPPEHYPPYHAQNASKLVQKQAGASNTFAFELYQELAKQEPDNIFFSPQSARVALAMAAEGARGNTRTEMLNALHLPYNDSVRRQYFKNLMQSITSSEEYNFSEANAVWIKEGYPILPDYISTVREYYLSEVHNTISPDEINAWAEEKTHGRIKRIVGQLPPLTRMVITNAVYFKGKWEKEFNESLTRQEPFTLASGETVKAWMMQTSGSFPYYENGRLQALELPYSGGRLSMVIVLPKNPADIDKLGESDFNECLWNLKNTSLAEVKIPRFKLETEYHLLSALMNLGMKDAFDPEKADFSGITQAEKLYIYDVAQKAFVQVDEQGTEAAAVTAVTVVATCVGCGGGQPLPRFIADHPFVFMILDKQTGEILFMGRVSDPSKEQ